MSELDHLSSSLSPSNVAQSDGDPEAGGGRNLAEIDHICFPLVGPTSHRGAEENIKRVECEMELKVDSNGLLRPRITKTYETRP